MGKRKLGWTVWSGIFGILFFLILLAIANIFLGLFSNNVFHLIIGFLNQNILTILLISIAFLLGNIFEFFIFPFNIFYPLFNAAGAILQIGFIFEIFTLVDVLAGTEIYTLLLPFYLLVIILVPIIVFTLGYVNIFANLIPEKIKVKSKKIIKENRESIEWNEIGEEIKLAFYNLFKTISDALEPKKRRRKKGV